MIKKLTIIFLVISNISFAQYPPVPTQFDTFIIQPNIEWAAYANDYFRFEKFNLNKLLFTRFLKTEIKASSPVASGTTSANFITYTIKDSLDERLYPMCVLPVYDSLGNMPEIKIEPYEIDTTASTLTDVAQILYIENGTLKSYIPWVSPSIVKITTPQTKQFLGYSEYISTCYNYEFSYPPKENNSTIFLGETTRKFRVDSIQSRSRLKELYGKNLLETLLPYILDNKLDIFNFGSDKKINLKEIADSALFVDPTLPKPINYDESSRKFVKYKYLEDYLNLEKFKEIKLVQDWYYNYTENIVFNKIKELYLCAKKWTMKGEDKETSPILKIVFK